LRAIFKSVACLCLALTLWSALAVAAHHHSNATEAAKCAICVAARSTTPQPASSPAKVTFSAVSIIPAEPIAAKQRLEAFALSVRPPPEV
jgi:hypothetical protein